MNEQDKDTTFSTRFQYYGGDITKCHPLGYVTLAQFIESTRHPKRGTCELFRKISAAAAAGDMMLKAQLKEQLYSFTPSVTVRNWRNYDNIESFTGLAVLDFDHVHNAEELKHYLFETYRCIIAAYLSPSKRGVKCIVLIPVCTFINEYKSYFFGLAAEMQQYYGFDPVNQNPVQPLFQSWDADLLFRDNPETWITKGIRRSDIKRTNVTAPPPPVIPTTADQEKVLKIIDLKFRNIIDVGHPNVLAISREIGGYVGAGYIDERTVIDIINSKIENHPYLKKAIANYQRTAAWAIEQGMKSPLTLKYSNI